MRDSYVGSIIMGDYQIFINTQTGEEIKARVIKFKNKESATQTLYTLGIDPSDIPDTNNLLLRGKKENYILRFLELKKKPILKLVK